MRRASTAYAPDEEGLYGLQNSIPDFDVVGATSLFTTVHDLAAWDRNFYTGRVGGRDAVDRLHSRFVLNDGDTISYAHGLGVGEYRGLRTVGHGGADAGYRSNFLRFPDEEWSVAVLCNFPSSNPGGLARQVADVWLEDAFPESAVADEEEGDADAATGPWVELPPEHLEALAGLYREEDGLDVERIRLENDTLRLAGPDYPLRPLGEDRFRLVGPEVTLALRPPRDGRPATLELPPEDDPRVYRRIPEWDPSAEELADFAGTYHSEELDTEYRFAVEEGRLVFHHRKLRDDDLSPSFQDAFRLWSRTLVFERNPEGRVVGFRMHDGRVYDVAFERVGG